MFKKGCGKESRSGMHNRLDKKIRTSKLRWRVHLPEREDEEATKRTPVVGRRSKGRQSEIERYSGTARDRSNRGRSKGKKKTGKVLKRCLSLTVC